MDLGELIRQYRLDHHLSQRQFADKCGGDITHGYIAIIEKGKNPNTGKPSRPSMEKLAAIATGLEMSIDNLLAAIDGPKKSAAELFGLQPRTSEIDSSILKAIEDAIKNAMPYSQPRASVPVFGSVRCGTGGLAYQDLQGSEPADVANPADYFYLRAEGDSMAPHIMDGDLVLIHIQPEVENGQLAVVVVNGEEGVLKKWVKKDNAVVLQSFNPAYPPRIFVGDEMELLRVAGRVVETKRRW